MTTYVALLRGINVGGNNKVEMSRLRECFEDLGYANVSTYINTGNVIFDTKTTSAPKLVMKIEKALAKTFGFEIRVVVRDSATIKKLCKAIPANWKNDTEQKTDVLFLWDAFKSKKSLSLLSQTPGVDNLVYSNGAIVWNLKRKHYTKSGMNDFIGTPLYKHVTVRNVNTVRKLGELM